MLALGGGTRALAGEQHVCEPVMRTQLKSKRRPEAAAFSSHLSQSASGACYRLQKVNHCSTKQDGYRCQPHNPLSF